MSSYQVIFVGSVERSGGRGALKRHFSVTLAVWRAIWQAHHLLFEKGLSDTQLVKDGAGCSLAGDSMEDFCLSKSTVSFPRVIVFLTP